MSHPADQDAFSHPVYGRPFNQPVYEGPFNHPVYRHSFAYPGYGGTFNILISMFHSRVWVLRFLRGVCGLLEIVAWNLGRTFCQGLD